LLWGWRSKSFFQWFLLYLLLPFEEIPFILKGDILKSRNRLVIEHCGVKDLVKTPFSISHNKDKYLVDQLGKLLLEFSGGLNQTGILFEIVQQ
jgi:hypothetical protein